MPSTSAAAPHVLIVGGGFAGLTAARALGRAPVRVTLVDRSNVHVFQPLLYQVATAGLAATDIAAPLRQIVRRQSNTTVLLAEVQAVDLAARRVRLVRAAGDGPRELAWDWLLLAPGAVPTWYGHEAWAPFAPGLKDLRDALEIRRRVLLAFEAAEAEEDPARRADWLSFAVIGGGPTGVELAGALAEIARHQFVGSFHHIDTRTARVVLVEAAPRVLATFAEELAADALVRLRRMGVEVQLGARVVGVDAQGVTLQAEGAPPERLQARTVVWAAGVRASPLLATLGLPLDRGGRVGVQPDLSLPGHPEVFVLGDAAAVPLGTAPDGRPQLVPGLAPAAIQMGAHAARQIRCTLAGQPRESFRYRDKGTLATIGRAAAVAEFGRIKLRGLPAWLVWVVVHVWSLIGFRNRVLVMFEWAWLYVTRQRGARVILAPQERPPD